MATDGGWALLRPRHVPYANETMAKRKEEEIQIENRKVVHMALGNMPFKNNTFLLENASLKHVFDNTPFKICF